jgi:hypothetical protein
MSKQFVKFVGIPSKTLLSKEWKDFSASTRDVYRAILLKYFREDGEDSNKLRWRQDELAALTGFTRKTVNSCIGELIDNEFISVWEPGGRWIDGTTYEIDRKWSDW